MAIPITRYVNITSVVGGGSAVPIAELIGRLFTINPLVPTGAVLEFDTASSVGDYFGTTSEEYKRAVQYFSFVGKNLRSPQTISFSRWVDEDTAPQIYGARINTPLATFSAISTGTLTLTLGGVTNTMSGMDFTSVMSFADVATIIQSAINDESGTQWSAATVSYDSTRGSFDFVGGDAVDANIVVSNTGSGVDIRQLIGWASGAILSAGSVTETITETLSNSANTSTNFGSFLFLPSLSVDEVVEAAEWNASQDVQFQYYVPTTQSNYGDYTAVLSDIKGVGLIDSDADNVNEYPDQGPMQTLAATDYDQPNAVQNYMFQQYGLTPTVFTESEANALDAARVNYNGRTQTAGVIRDFFQRGVLQGDPTSDPIDMNVYANEQWLRAAMTSNLMTLLLISGRIPANNQGRGDLLASMQSVMNKAVNNGTVSVGKTLTDAQKAFITSVTGDPTAWYQVQSIGYRMGVTMDAQSNTAFYSVIYSKDDVIRKIDGTQVLI